MCRSGTRNCGLGACDNALGLEGHKEINESCCSSLFHVWELKKDGSGLTPWAAAKWRSSSKATKGFNNCKVSAKTLTNVKKIGDLILIKKKLEN